MVINHRSSAPVNNSADFAIARAALISVDQLGPGWAPESTVSPSSSWAEFRELFAAQPECAGYTAAVHSLEATAAGAMASHINLKGQVISEELTIYSSKDAASRVMDRVEATGFQNCFFATYDAASSIGFPGSGPTTTSYNIAPPPPAHGDRQISFGQETRTLVDSQTRLFHNVWVQVDRSIIHIVVSPDGFGSDNPAGNLEKSIATSIALLNKAMSTG